MKTIERLDTESLLVKDGDLKYVQFDSLLKYEDRLTHCFTTRIGGVSSGECSSLNLGFKRKDTRENVAENFRRLCNVLAVDYNSLVFSDQIHSNKIKIVTSSDSDLHSDNITGFDGLVTGEAGITLVTFFADCVPVLLYEKSGKAIASIHSGWRSTLKCITHEAVQTLYNNLHIDPKDLICVIGPGIGKCCFEVDRDVYEEFGKRFCDESFYTSLDNGKWKIDLREIIKANAIAAGIPAVNIHTSSICTKCRKDLFFSYRGDCGKTGSLAAFMHLKKV